MDIREGKRRSKTEREKRDKVKTERAVEGKKSEREKRQQIRNENEVRTEISSKRGKMQGRGGAVEPNEKERFRDSEKREGEKKVEKYEMKEGEGEKYGKRLADRQTD